MHVVSPPPSGLCLSLREMGMWTMPEAKDIIRTTGTEDNKMNLVTGDCNLKNINERRQSKDILGQVSKTHHAIQTFDKTISNLEMELAAARAAQESILNGSPLSENVVAAESTERRKYFMVVGINTAFSSRKRRDSVRATWMLQGEKRKKLEEEKGIIIRFVIGHSATSGGILDKAIEAEDRKHGDFMRLDHIEGYLELSAKTKAYFASAVARWDADFYIKVDDDVHVNIATLGTTLARHRSNPRVYIGCMKSGPVLARKGVRYHEPEYWKFGEEGNKYFRHATGQIYAISKDLASYISINRHVLHKYANEDVSLGAWFIGLDVEHIDDRRLCCGTPPVAEVLYLANEGGRDVTPRSESMGSGNGAPSWADQWGNSGGLYDDSDDETKARGSAKKTGNMKAVASASLDKAKAAATVGAQKVKSGTSMGIKWVKTRCQKRTSK
ncbi:putative beta-1,3-galactosyltransferase 2 [Cocos nucifera]|uniref:Hexosyltransferase n=1 Tax=Cocos nucifera TaxID=13894 RepID=A0A8K0N2X4_COCNU|nr:putative beta-1,3-galactosyltransferase 2 [Cocos nucifera]